MIVLMSAAGVAAVGSVLLARIAATKSSNVKKSSRNSTEIAQEMKTLSALLIENLDRLKKSPNVNQSSELEEIMISFDLIVKTAWTVSSQDYYGHKIISFRRVLGTFVQLVQKNPRKESYDALREVIETMTPLCYESLIRGDNGSEVTSFTFNAMEKIERITDRFSIYNRQFSEDGTFLKEWTRNSW